MRVSLRMRVCSGPGLVSSRAALRRTDEFAETFEKVRLDSSSSPAGAACIPTPDATGCLLSSWICCLRISAAYCGSVCALPQFAAEKCAPFKGVQAEGEQPLECMAVSRSTLAVYTAALYHASIC